MSLSVLSQYSDLDIHQTHNGCCGWFCESCGCCEDEQTYKITTSGKNPKKDAIFHAQEESSCLNRCCCGTNRGFDLYVHSGQDKTAPVIVDMHRDLACGAGSCCCQQTMRVTDHSSKKELGRAYIPYFCCNPQIDVVDADGNLHYTMTKDGCGVCGMCQVVCCESCRSIPFEVKNAKGEEVGKVTKKFGGIGREMFSDTDTFTMKFPTDATPEQRALLLGAVFLLDINFFETDNKDKK